MSIKVAINGYGRIGRNVLRAIYETGRSDEFEVVAINGPADFKIAEHLTRRDTVHGPFSGEVVLDGDHLVVNGDRIRLIHNRDPATLPWGELSVDIVLECTGAFNSREKSSTHLESGAGKVLISAPAGKDMPTVVYGVNHDVIKSDDRIVSCASCTTNGLAPLVKPLHDAFVVEQGLMTTIHAYTNDQALTDVRHKDPRRARSATMNQIPTKTGAAAAVGLVMPELDGKLDGCAIRIPTINVSLVDLSFLAGSDVSVDAVNDVMRKAAEDGPLKDILGYNTEPLVSSDFNHDPRSSIFDATLTKVSGRLVKVFAWYDNEWGFSNRMLDTAAVMASA